MRQIKPEFFLDDELDRLSEVHQKLFIGLWCLADAEGRLVDNTKKIKAQIFPYRDYDVGPLLDDLHNAGFIARYEAVGHACIQVLKFKKHQKPHPKEMVFGLPNPPENIPSREISRPEIKDQPGIPSRPAFNGEWRMENGSLENGEPEKQKPPPPLPKKPDDPFESGDALFAQVQHDRHAAGYVTERPPHPRALGNWFSEFMGELNGDADRASATIKTFFKSTYWREKNFPFQALMKNWREFTPRREVA